MAKKITLIYHHDPECWWVKSPDIKGYTAVGDNLEELRNRIFNELPEFEGYEMEFIEVFPEEKQAKTA